ncbi:MAG: hypothetical protein K9M10_03300 [Candidatus Pacebacteria bacterium]|nr:hypothetical protein [Candidatus Paceibacterota bacterium]MCF7857481.1 hypothetical protein [Candidatus Paceibacterota bacterium]
MMLHQNLKQINMSDFFAVANFPKTPSPKPARIPPQTPPAGGKSAEAGRIHSPRQIVSPCRVRFNHLDSARNSFELCPANTAKIRNSNFRQKYGRREAPSVLHSPHKILILQGFATLRVARRLPIQKYE